MPEYRCIALPATSRRHCGLGTVFGASRRQWLRLDGAAAKRSSGVSPLAVAATLAAPMSDALSNCVRLMRTDVGSLVGRWADGAPKSSSLDLPFMLHPKRASKQVSQTSDVTSSILRKPQLSCSCQECHDCSKEVLSRTPRTGEKTFSDSLRWSRESVLSLANVIFRRIGVAAGPTTCESGTWRVDCPDD